MIVCETDSQLQVLVAVMASLLGLTSIGEAISCYVCQSENGDNPDCEDPFFTNRTETFLQTPCMAGRKQRNGAFPATACIKMSGTFDDLQTIMIRTCALDSGSLTIDTELVRMSHCGSLVFEGNYVKGCLASCYSEGCNSASRLGTLSYLPVIGNRVFPVVATAVAVTAVSSLSGVT